MVNLIVTIFQENNERSYSLYHSVYDGFYWVEKFLDTNFEYHKAIGLVWMNVAPISDHPIGTIQCYRLWGIYEGGSQ